MKDFFRSQHKHNEHLQLRYHQTDGACLTLVDISQVAAALLHQKEQTLFSWLTGEENQYMQRFRFPKRYNEWLSGRIAAKCCLLQSLDSRQGPRRPDDFSILPDTHGQPILSSKSTGSHPRISISHSHQYAVAIAANQACGIDIQNIGSQILKVKDRIANATERTLAQQIFPRQMEIGLTMLWAIKEALKKHRLPEQPGIFEAITIGRIMPGAGKNSWLAECRLSRDNQIHIVHVAHLDQYILAWSQG